VFQVLAFARLPQAFRGLVMGWVQRRGRRYYYRSRWVNGRDVKEYVGTGEAAELAAKLDAKATEAGALQVNIAHEQVNVMNAPEVEESHAKQD
jgi:hypothetical protein